MKVVTSLTDGDLSHPSVVSIGNFDGLHLGHRKILETVLWNARKRGLQAVAMTFEPHPIRFLAPDRAPRMISTLDQKIRLIGDAGIDLLFIARFDEQFSRLHPEEFIRQYLIDGLKARSVCVGGNFNFGYRQSGTIQTLREFKSGLEVIEVPPVRVRGTVVSSSRIRELAGTGAVSRACRLLGRWIQLEGRIVSGAGRGRTMKAPTLNLDPINELIPGIGVYVSRISVDGGPMLEAVTNIGVRPTFNETKLTIETFVLNDGVPPDPKMARLNFIYRLRDEKKFESPGELQAQIAMDIKSASRMHRKLKSYDPD